MDETAQPLTDSKTHDKSVWSVWRWKLTGKPFNLASCLGYRSSSCGGTNSVSEPTRPLEVDCKGETLLYAL